MEKLRYFLKDSLRNIWLNRMMSLASISVLTVCLLLLGTSILISYNINDIRSKIEDQIQIMVILNDSLDQNGITDVGKQIKAIPNVRSSVFISKQQGLEEQKKTMGKYAYLLTGYEKENQNPLPNAYRIVLKNMSNFTQTVKALSKINGISEIKQHADIAIKLNNIKSVINMIGFWLFAILAFISLFIISNTIKVAMFVRKREVNIMKFVGATDWFIRWPFLFEGLIIGIISSTVACVALWFIYSVLLTNAIKESQILQLVNFKNMYAYIYLGYYCAGIVVGTLGSIISVRRHLKV
jgi:cell division transport system permease protein